MGCVTGRSYTKIFTYQWDLCKNRSTCGQSQAQQLVSHITYYGCSLLVSFRDMTIMTDWQINYVTFYFSFADGVHLKKGPKAGKPWIPPAHARPLPDDDPDDLTDYVNSLYQSPDAVPYPPVQAMPPPPSNRKLRGFRCPQPNSYFRYTQNCEEYVNCTVRYIWYKLFFGVKTS